MPLKSPRTDVEENGTLLNDQLSKEPWTSIEDRPQISLPWIIAALSTTVAIISVVLNILHLTQDSRCIFPTDLPGARGAIEYEQRTYTGGLVYDAELDQGVRLHDAPVEYFGPPSEEIDDAWKELLRGEFPPMTEEEAAPYLPELRPLRSTGSFQFEPDMFHSLHCLNAVRTALAPTLYHFNTTHSHMEGLNLGPDWEAAHMEHCMDRLRQTIMCFGDLTPSPMYYWDGFPVAIGRSGEHTCRRWEPIRRWMDERGKLGKTLEGV